MTLKERYESEIKSLQKERDEYYENTKKSLENVFIDELGWDFFFEDDAKPFSEHLKEAFDALYDVLLSIESRDSLYDKKILSLKEEIRNVTINSGGEYEQQN